MAYVFHEKSYVLIFTKIDWATLWATFSQTHLVTLMSTVDISGFFLRGSMRPFSAFWLQAETRQVLEILIIILISRTPEPIL
jgi:hypothetical protein